MPLLITPSFFGTHFPLGSQDHVLLDTLSGLFCWPSPLCWTAKCRRTRDSERPPLTLRLSFREPHPAPWYKYSLFNNYSLSIHSALPAPAVPDSHGFQVQQGPNRSLSSRYSPNPVLPSNCSSQKLGNYP